MNAKRPRSRTIRLVGRVRAAIDRGAEAAESIHKRAANRSIAAVYDLVRSVNHELGRLAERLVEGEPARKRRPVRRRAQRGAAHQAA